MTDDEARRPTFSWRHVRIAGVGAVLVAVGVVAGALWNRSSAPASKPTAAPLQVRHLIDVTQARGASCRPPAAPGKGHPDPVLAQIFTVHDSAHREYLLGWQIVPYRGAARSYTFGRDGNLISLEPSSGGPPLGFGRGSVTFAAKASTGTVRADIALTDGGSIAVAGTWTCPGSD